MVRSDEVEWWFNAVYAAVRKCIFELRLFTLDPVLQVLLCIGFAMLILIYV